MHLVDIENLVGDPMAGPDAVLEGFEAFCKAAELGTFDHVVVACNPRMAGSCAWRLASCRVLPATGPDGADERLVSYVGVDMVIHRYHRLVIGSGDHIFADFAREVRNAGGLVWVVSRPESLSSSLARVAQVVRPLQLTVAA